MRSTGARGSCESGSRVAPLAAFSEELEPEPGCRFKWWIKQRCRKTQDPLLGTHVAKAAGIGWTSAPCGKLPPRKASWPDPKHSRDVVSQSEKYERKTENEPSMLLQGTVLPKRISSLLFLSGTRDQIVKNRSLCGAAQFSQLSVDGKTEFGYVPGSNVYSPEPRKLHMEYLVCLICIKKPKC